MPRTTPFKSNTRGATGWCLEPHDLVLAKLVAGREKDLAYARAAVAAGIVALPELRRRVTSLPVAEAPRVSVLRMLDALD